MLVIRVADNPLDVVEQTTYAKYILNQTFGEVGKGVKLVFVSSFMGNLDQMM